MMHTSFAILAPMSTEQSIPKRSVIKLDSRTGPSGFTYNITWKVSAKSKATWEDGYHHVKKWSTNKHEWSRTSIPFMRDIALVLDFTLPFNSLQIDSTNWCGVQNTNIVASFTVTKNHINSKIPILASTTNLHSQIWANSVYFHIL